MEDEYRELDPVTDPAKIARMKAVAAQYGFPLKTEKAIRPELHLEPTPGVPGPLESERALSRLAILPNPPEANLEEPIKYVESPWETIPTFTVDPNIWDNANISLINLDELVGTDPYLSRKRVKKHIVAMGQALTPYRHYALVVARNGQNVILDGHHRLMAQWLLGQQAAPVWLAEEN